MCLLIIIFPMFELFDLLNTASSAPLCSCSDVWCYLEYVQMPSLWH